jgi:hypothetical protein
VIFGRISVKLAYKTLLNKNINWTLIHVVPSNVNKDHAKVYSTKLDLWLIKKKEKC